jgi:hypothetical protein
MDARQQWMAFLIQQALEYQLVTPDDVLRYATPRVIATLPNELKARVLRAGLNQGVFNPDVILSVLSPETLAETVPLPTLWGCIAEAGAKHFGGDVAHLTSSEVDTVLERVGPAARPPHPAPAEPAPKLAPPELQPPEGDDPFHDAESMIVIEDDAPESTETPSDPSAEAGWNAGESTGIDHGKKDDDKSRAKTRRALTRP